MAFAQRDIDLSFRLGQGDFGAAGEDTLSLTGLRCSVNITKAGGAQMASADLRIWGMPLDAMNRLTVLNTLAYAEQRFNQVTVSAGDEYSGMAVCFTGTIREAWADGRDAPDVAFHISAFVGFFDLIQPAPPVSYSGQVDVALALAGVAAQMGYTFENNGVTGRIDSPYWPGSIKAQIEAICEAGNLEFTLDEGQRVLAAWPKGAARNGEAILINRKTGLVGYPSFMQNGVQVRTLYNPSLAFGRTIQIQSEFEPANKQWVIAAISHNLDAKVPGGQWFTEVSCTTFGSAPAIPTR